MHKFFTHEPKALVSETASNLMYVDIHARNMLYKSFDYIIYGDDQKMLRRGTFRSPTVQLCTSDLKEGTYEFKLMFNGEVYQTTKFVKCRPAEQVL